MNDLYFVDFEHYSFDFTTYVIGILVNHTSSTIVTTSCCCNHSHHKNPQYHNLHGNLQSKNY